MTQVHGKALWPEPAGSGATPTVRRAVFRVNGARKFAPTFGATPQAALIDVYGNGKYLLVDLRTEYVFVDNGHGKATLAVNGAAPAVAVMALVTGKLTQVPVGTAPQAAQFFVGPTGKLLCVPLAARRASMVLVGGKVRVY